jgi:hypothetical protein
MEYNTRPKNIEDHYLKKVHRRQGTGYVRGQGYPVISKKLH